MLSLVFLIPIIFFFCLVTVASYQLITKYTQVQHECRTHVLRTQQVLGKKLKELMDLNPRAKFLRVEEAQLRATIASLAAIPPATIPFINLLNINLARQTALRFQQEKVIATATIEGKKIMGELPYKIKNPKYSSVNLKIYKSPPFAIAPDHQPLPFFTELQTIKVNWQYSIGDFIPDVTLKFFSKTNYPVIIEGKCAATLIRKGDVWNPKLHLARF